MTQDWRARGAVSREEAAEILGLSPGKIDDLRAEAKLVAKKEGRRVLIPVWSIRAYLGEVEAPLLRPTPPARSSRVNRLVREALHRAG